MDKPITVARQEFIESTVISINQSGLPAFVLAEVLQGLVNTLRQQEQQQLERDMKAYKKAQEEQCEKDKDKEQEIPPENRSR